MSSEQARTGVVRRALSWMGREVLQAGRRMGRWTSKRWQMGRVRREIRRLEAHRRDLCQAMGEKVYLLFQRNQVHNRDLLVLCQEIRDLDVSLDAKEEDYRRIYLEGVEVRSMAAVEVADEALEQPSPASPRATEGPPPPAVPA